MIKKIGIFALVLTVAFLFVAPIGADPSDVVLDQQIQLGVPGTFQLVDADSNGKAEAIEFLITIRSYREGNFTLTADLEALDGEHWIPVSTTVMPFKWNFQDNQAKLTFYPAKLIEGKLDGAYRVSLSLKEGNWVLPQQVVGFTQKYTWQMFEDKGVIQEAAESENSIASSAEAKRAAEAWAELNRIELGQFAGVSYNYDAWKVDFHPKRWTDRLIRFVINPRGDVKVLKINPRG